MKAHTIEVKKPAIEIEIIQQILVLFFLQDPDQDLWVRVVDIKVGIQDQVQEKIKEINMTFLKVDQEKIKDMREGNFKKEKI